MPVRRYDPNRDGGMDEDKTGRWVKFNTVKRIMLERDKLKHDLERCTARELALLNPDSQSDAGAKL